uniref:HSF-type DNA-binding domain-containing protein n=1 Tax=Mola mola TaxID=94237 RepID=A0A3Q3XPG6_MOLML
MVHVCVFADQGADVGGNLFPDRIHPQKFPAKLWHLVNSPENRVICWNPNGDAVVVDQMAFEGQVLAQSPVTADTGAFKTTNFSSFVHQLSKYGFMKADPAANDPGREGGTCHYFRHPNFQRGHPENLKNIPANHKRMMGVSRCCVQM